MDPAGADVYHTNVMMAVGTDVAVVCAEAVPDDRQREHLLQRLRRHHKVLLPPAHLSRARRQEGLLQRSASSASITSHAQGALQDDAAMQSVRCELGELHLYDCGEGGKQSAEPAVIAAAGD